MYRLGGIKRMSARGWRAPSIRLRLLALALAPLAMVLPVLVAILASWGSEYFDRLMVTKVRSDLAVAHGYFERVQAGVGHAVQALAGSERLARARRAHDAGALNTLLADARTQLQPLIRLTPPRRCTCGPAFCATRPTAGPPRTYCRRRR